MMLDRFLSCFLEVACRVAVYITHISLLSTGNIEACYIWLVNTRNALWIRNSRIEPSNINIYFKWLFAKTLVKNVVIRYKYYKHTDSLHTFPLTFTRPTVILYSLTMKVPSLLLLLKETFQGISWKKNTPPHFITCLFKVLAWGHKWDHSAPN